MGDRITDLDFLARLNPRDDIADVPRRDLLARIHVQAEDADFIRIVLLPGGDELYMVSLTDSSVDDLEVSDDTTEWIKD